jgi:voltage-gated potassium channel Kch
MTAVTIPTSREEILASRTRRALPRPVEIPETDIASYFQGLDNFHRVFAIKPGDHVVFLTDPLLDPRVVQAVYGLAGARGATFASYMGTSTQLMRAPEEAKALIERATFVVSTWFASIHDPFIVGLRKNKGQRWIKITYFRNLDLLKTPQARFPIDLLAEIIQATARLYPESGNFDLRFTDSRGSDVRISLDQTMKSKLLGGNRWRGQNIADEDGCYIHYIPTHGPNLYDRTVVDRNFDAKVPFNGILYPQWGVGFEKPFEEKIGVEFKDERVVAVTGQSKEAEILREMLVGGLLEELGCGHNPWAPRFDIYPAGPNSPGGLHFGINALKPSPYLKRVLPNWEEPHVHMDLVTFDSTVTAGNRTLIDEGYLMSLKDPQVIALAERYGNPHELLEAFPV